MTEKTIQFPINQYSHLPLVRQLEERAIRTAIVTGYLSSRAGVTQEAALIDLINNDDDLTYKDTNEQTLRDYIAAGFSLYQERPELTGHEAFHLSKNHYEAMIKRTPKANK
ncbi:hypothetical protein [Methylobacter luteus]|uniref:hypothetical protein n=1 Tax=Methylobacter luteus TaxID=415 RepID=UPI000480B74A|nr:hypothetical protein [Methylobacter luteus]